MKRRAMPLGAALVLVMSIAAAIAVWPTAYRMGWAVGVLGTELPVVGEEPAAAGRYVLALARAWWFRVNTQPPMGWDWLGVFGVSAFAGAALMVVIAKVVVLALVTAAGLGAACGAIVTRFRCSLVALELFRSRVAPLLRWAVRLWVAEFFLVVAAILMLDAAALALRAR